MEAVKVSVPCSLRCGHVTATTHTGATQVYRQAKNVATDNWPVRIGRFPIKGEITFT